MSDAPDTDDTDTCPCGDPSCNGGTDAHENQTYVDRVEACDTGEELYELAYELASKLDHIVCVTLDIDDSRRAEDVQ